MTWVLETILSLAFLAYFLGSLIHLRLGIRMLALYPQLKSRVVLLVFVHFFLLFLLGVWNSFILLGLERGRETLVSISLLVRVIIFNVLFLLFAEFSRVLSSAKFHRWYHVYILLESSFLGLTCSLVILALLGEQPLAGGWVWVKGFEVSVHEYILYVLTPFLLSYQVVVYGFFAVLFISGFQEIRRFVFSFRHPAGQQAPYLILTAIFGLFILELPGFSLYFNSTLLISELVVDVLLYLVLSLFAHFLFTRGSVGIITSEEREKIARMILDQGVIGATAFALSDKGPVPVASSLSENLLELQHLDLDREVLSAFYLGNFGQGHSYHTGGVFIQEPPHFTSHYAIIIPQIIRDKEMTDERLGQTNYLVFVIYTFKFFLLYCPQLPYLLEKLLKQELERFQAISQLTTPHLAEILKKGVYLCLLEKSNLNRKTLEVKT